MDIFDEVKQYLEDGYTNGIEYVVNIVPVENGIEGQFFDKGTVFDYSITDDGITYQENRVDSEYIADYFRARMDAMGIRCDSDNPYEYYRGYFFEERDDAFSYQKPRCKNGTVPCGFRCLPRGQKCSIGSGSIGAAKKERQSKILEKLDLGRKGMLAGDFIRKAVNPSLGSDKTLLRSSITNPELEGTQPSEPEEEGSSYLSQRGKKYKISPSQKATRELLVQHIQRPGDKMVSRTHIQRPGDKMKIQKY